VHGLSGKNYGWDEALHVSPDKGYIWNEALHLLWSGCEWVFCIWCAAIIQRNSTFWFLPVEKAGQEAAWHPALPPLHLPRVQNEGPRRHLPTGSLTVCTLCMTSNLAQNQQAQESAVKNGRCALKQCYNNSRGKRLLSRDRTKLKFPFTYSKFCLDKLSPACWSLCYSAWLILIRACWSCCYSAWSILILACWSLVILSDQYRSGHVDPAVILPGQYWSRHVDLVVFLSYQYWSGHVDPVVILHDNTDPGMLIL
jgi:hypothetical protein